MASLAAEVLRQTPEYTHFAPGAHFKWVLFVPPSPDPYPEVTKTLRTALKKKYSLYDKRADLPASSIEKTPAGEGYVGGFQFTVTIKQLDKDKIEVQYNDFENPIAAGDQTIRYQWIKGAWKEIWRSAMAVS
ncbi:MAG TPA: hypothetical protein VFG11_03340 [Acidobacteriota bacterium]|nr:hypothetical protein [Acidobacteriota bacterium]